MDAYYLITWIPWTGLPRHSLFLDECPDDDKLVETANAAWSAWDEIRVTKIAPTGFHPSEELVKVILPSDGNKEYK